MFRSVLTKKASGTTENLCLLINPIGNTNSAKFIFFNLEFDSKDNSIWEIYRNQTIVSNGTLINTVKLDGTATNTIELYKNPTIISFGRFVRKFMLPTSTKEFSTNAPIARLEPGDSLILRRISDNTGNIINTWIWQEIETN